MTVKVDLQITSH